MGLWLNSTWLLTPCIALNTNIYTHSGKSYHVQVYVHSFFKKVTKIGQIMYAENINGEHLNNALAFPFLNGI